MITHQLALIRREIWEHRSIWVTPAAIAVIVSLGTIATLVFASGFGERLDIAIFGASNIAGETERAAALTAFFLGFSWLFLIATAIVTVFYSLDCLYAERKDKSILFWRSLPITDFEAVLSKLLTAIVVIPLVALAVIIVTHIVNLAFISVWVAAKGGDAGHLIWGSVTLFDSWFAGFIVMLSAALWLSPFVGWFLLVSALTKRSPLLMAFMPLIVIPLIEFIFLRTSFFADAVFARRGNMPLFRRMDLEKFFDEDRMHLSDETVSLLAHIDVVRFISSPSVWIGLVVCALLTTAAIYVRRYRDESY